MDNSRFAFACKVVALIPLFCSFWFGLNVFTGLYFDRIDAFALWCASFVSFLTIYSVGIIVINLNVLNNNLINLINLQNKNDESQEHDYLA